MAKCTASQPAWQTVLADAVRSPAELVELLRLPSTLADEAQQAADGYPLLVPRPYLARIRPGDPADPLLRQVLPRAAETTAVPGYTADPLGEAAAHCGPGLLRKYQGRLLILATPACPVHCRYCFRRHFLRGTAQETTSEDASPIIPPHCNGGAFRSELNITAAREAIAADPSIHEVILSGGDPLMLPDDELARLIGQLSEVPHVRRIRIHTRMPVVIPQRVTQELIDVLRTGAGAERRGSGNLQFAICNLQSSICNSLCPAPLLVVQINHPAELDAPVAAALGRLIDAGIPVLNQSVLLRGVNDRADVLAELCERLIDLRVIPYYLHQLDPVAGAAHFEVPVPIGQKILSELRARLPGYAVPRYVRETPGGVSKEALA
jgi:L-lysine 2,3-aminomutase